MFGNDAEHSVLLAEPMIEALIKALNAMNDDTKTPTDSLMAPLVLPMWNTAIKQLEKDLNDCRSTMIKAK